MEKLWRYIEDHECEPYYNMALDEAISICVRKGVSLPTLRLYSWKRPSITIGYFQKINDIDYEYCRENNIPVIRRITGGRAIFHDVDITYSINVNKDSEIFSCSLFESYKKIGYAFYSAFLNSSMDVEIESTRHRCNETRSPYCFQAVSFAEIMYKGHKIIGSAQKRWSNGFLQQGCIPLLIDKHKLQKIFRLNGDCLNTILTINDLSKDLSIDKVKENILLSFAQTLNIEFLIGKPEKEELKITNELLKDKYTKDEWIYKR